MNEPQHNGGQKKEVNHSKHQILVIDDDTTFLKLITRILQDEGYQVDAAETGREALEKTRETYYSLVLVDRKLPDADGVELLAKIGDTDPKIRKIIFTGFPSTDIIQDAISLGVHVYLAKPVDPQKIIETVKKQLEERNKESKKIIPTLK